VEVARLCRVEIGVADVPAADDGEAAIGNPGLVVHAARHAEGAQGELEAAADAVCAVPARIEQPDLDAGMRIEFEIARIVAAGVDVVDQQSDAHAAIGRSDDLAHEQAAGGILAPVVILQVEAAAGAAGGEGPCGKGLRALREQDDAIESGMGRQQRAERPVDRGVGIGRRQRMRRRSAGVASEAAIGIGGRHRGERDQGKGCDQDFEK
jgi:hypothetical protein